MALDRSTVLAQIKEVESEERRLASLKQHLTKLLDLVTGGGAAKMLVKPGEAVAARVSRRRGGRRIRRSAEELQKFAAEVVEFIKAGGEEGRTGGEINAKFGPPQGTATSTLLQKFAAGQVKSKGQRASKRYFFAGSK